MPAKIDADSNLRFLYSCFKHSNYATINYNNVAVDFDIKAPAARMRLMRLKIALDGQNALQKRFGTGNVPNYPSIGKGSGVSGVNGGGGGGIGGKGGKGWAGKGGAGDDDDDEIEDSWRPGVLPGWIQVKSEEDDGKALKARRMSWGRNGGRGKRARVKSEEDGGDGKRRRRDDGASGGIQFQTEDLFGRGGGGGVKMEEGEGALKTEGLGIQNEFLKTELFGDDAVRFKTEEDVFGEAGSFLEEGSVGVKMEGNMRDRPVLFKTEDLFSVAGVLETGDTCQTPMSIDLEAVHSTPVQCVARDVFTTPTSVKTEEMDTTPMSLSVEPMHSTPASFRTNEMYRTPLSLKAEEMDDSVMTEQRTRYDTPMAVKTETMDDSEPMQSTPRFFLARDIFATPMSGKTEEMVISPLTEGFQTPISSATKNIYCTPTNVKTETRDSFIDMAEATEQTSRKSKEEDSLEGCMSMKEEVLQEGGLEENLKEFRKEVLQDTQEEGKNIRDIAASSVVQSPAIFLSGPATSAVQGFPVQQDIDNEGESKAWAAISSPVFTDTKQENNMV